MRLPGLRFLTLVIGFAVSEVPCFSQAYSISIYAGGGSLPPTVAPQPATNVSFYPQSVATDTAGNVYATGSDIVVKITPGGTITVIAGTGQPGYSGDGGAATNAQLSFGGDLNNPAGIAVDAAGNVYVSDAQNKRVRKISSIGIITTVAGGGTYSLTGVGDGGPAIAAGLLSPGGLAIDAVGNLYIADGLVRKVSPAGIITTVAGCLGITAACIQAGLSGSLGDGGSATNAGLLYAQGVAVDSSGNLFLADLGNHRIRKVSTSGIITTIAGAAGASFQGDGGPATSSGLYQPNAVAVDSSGNVYIDDAGDYRIRRIGTDGTITTIAGNGAEAQLGITPANNLPATSTSISPSNGVALGVGGKIFISDADLGVRVLTPPGGGQGTPAIQSGGVVSASAFGQFTSVAPGSWIEIYGSNLAFDSRSWSSSDFNGIQAPTQLDGTTVTIGLQPAFIDYISPTQLDVQVPSNAALGSQTVVVNTVNGASVPYSIDINAVQPGLLSPSSFNIGGKQYAAALFSDGSTFVLPTGAIPGVVSRPAKPGETITLYGIGFGPVNPNIPAGQIAQQANSLASTLQVLIGSLPTQVAYDGLAPNAVGLYQFNVVIPAVQSTGAAALTFVDGSTHVTQTLYIAVSTQ